MAKNKIFEMAGLQGDKKAQKRYEISWIWTTDAVTKFVKKLIRRIKHEKKS